MPFMQARGLIRGLPTALREFFAQWRGGDFSGGALAPSLAITLPIPDVYSFAYLENVTVTVAAGGGALVAAFTLPSDQRARLIYVVATRTSGDNTLDSLEVGFPTGYLSGTTRLGLWVETAAGIRWPRPANDTQASPPSPLALEPGSVVYLDPTGAGAAQTVWNLQLVLFRTKLVRALVP